jgi:hypothetical protein
VTNKIVLTRKSFGFEVKTIFFVADYEKKTPRHSA